MKNDMLGEVATESESDTQNDRFGCRPEETDFVSTVQLCPSTDHPLSLKSLSSQITG